MASVKKSSKKSKAGARASAKSKSRKPGASARAGAKRTMAKAATASARRKSTASRSVSARASQARTAPGKSTHKSAKTTARAETSKSKAAARRNTERKTTTVEMRKKNTASAHKAEARSKPAARKPTAAGRAVAKPGKAGSATKATKIASTTKALKPVEPMVGNVKDVVSKVASASKTAGAGAAPAAKANPPKVAPKASTKREVSASTILLETIRRVGQAAADAKARVVPAKADVASVASAPPAERAEAMKPVAAVAPATEASAPVTVPSPARPAFGSPGAGRAGFPSGDSRLHHLQARPVTKPTGMRPSFRLEEFIVYPAHGVGQIVAIEEQEVAGFKLELYVISFAKDKMTLKVPTPKVVSVGMRKLAEPTLVKKALDVLTGRARVKRTMWSRRAQEYEAKINSGDLIAIAEVIRDLYRSEAQPEQSYSERQLYEAALDRMAREIGAVQKLTETETLKVVDAQLQKGPRRGTKPEGEGESEGEAEVEEAAA